MFGKRRLPALRVDHDAPAHVYMIHYVEHDHVIMCDAPNIHCAATFARNHMHVFAPDDARSSRDMLYDVDRICVIIYGRDMQYTCNIVRMPVHMHNTRANITLAA